VADDNDLGSRLPEIRQGGKARTDPTIVGDDTGPICALCERNIEVRSHKDGPPGNRKVVE
jgi:hypothetical protein